MDEIKAMINLKRRRLIVNISDLHSFRDLGNRSVTRLVFSRKWNTIEGSYVVILSFAQTSFFFLSQSWFIFAFSKIIGFDEDLV